MPEVVAQDCRNMRLAFGKSKKILTDTLQNAEGVLGGGRSGVLVYSACQHTLGPRDWCAYL